MYIEFTCPPVPHLVVAGESTFRPGDIHESRILTEVFDLILVTKGTLFIEEDDYQFSLRPNDYLILLPEHRNRGFRPCLEETHFYWVHFNTTGHYQKNYSTKGQKQKKMNRRRFYQRDDFSIFISNEGHLDASTSAYIQESIRNLSEVQINNNQRQKLFFDPKMAPLEAQQSFLSILSILRSKNEDEDSNNLPAQIYSYIQAHSKQPFSLEDIAKTFAYHKSYIIQLIKKNYDLTPTQLHNQLRLEESKNLLLKSDYSIQRIAEETGFYDSAYFSRRFKEYTGISPSVWRKQHLSS
ncbi:helix-turn-helix domain-containing protein [Enterococcus sp. DIV0876]|uniref:helix-turn-helix domain-containing protein n=1 Tax=Enterococcus sp. DIV0876 TaxID=2774633 RepID=UPI003D2FCEE9